MLSKSQQKMIGNRLFLSCWSHARGFWVWLYTTSPGIKCILWAPTLQLQLKVKSFGSASPPCFSSRAANARVQLGLRVSLFHLGVPKLLPSNWTLDNGQGVAISHTNQHPVSQTIPKQTTEWTRQKTYRVSSLCWFLHFILVRIWTFLKGNLWTFSVYQSIFET